MKRRRSRSPEQVRPKKVKHIASDKLDNVLKDTATKPTNLQEQNIDLKRKCCTKKLHSKKSKRQSNLTKVKQSSKAPGQSSNETGKNDSSNLENILSQMSETLSQTFPKTPVPPQLSPTHTPTLEYASVYDENAEEDFYDTEDDDMPVRRYIITHEIPLQHNATKMFVKK